MTRLRLLNIANTNSQQYCLHSPHQNAWGIQLNLSLELPFTLSAHIAMFGIQCMLQMVHLVLMLCHMPIPDKMYTEWLFLSAELCIFSYILLHVMRLITRIWLQSAGHIKHELKFPHVFRIFPYFSEIFRNFPGNFPEIFRNIIVRKICITSNDLWPRLIFKGFFSGHESENGAYHLNGCS